MRPLLPPVYLVSEQIVKSESITGPKSTVVLVVPRNTVMGSHAPFSPEVIVNVSATKAFEPPIMAVFPLPVASAHMYCFAYVLPVFPSGSATN